MGWLLEELAIFVEGCDCFLMNKEISERNKFAFNTRVLLSKIVASLR